MHRVLKKEQVLTVPNFLSLLRILMIPMIIWLYCDAKRYYAAANGMILACGLIMLFSFVMYVRFYLRFWRESRCK